MLFVPSFNRTAEDMTGKGEREWEYGTQQKPAGWNHTGAAAEDSVHGVHALPTETNIFLCLPLMFLI